MNDISQDLEYILSLVNIDDLIPAFERGMENLQQGKKDKGSFTQDQKTQILQGRWCSKRKSALEDVSYHDTFIARNVHVTIKVSEKGLIQVVDFRVLWIYTKHYNKWCLCEQGRQPWSKEKTGNYKVYARMVSYDPSFDNHKAVSPIDSTHWSKKSIYVLCDSKKIEAIVGKFGPSLKKM